jgi:hypothetical protein
MERASVGGLRKSGGGGGGGEEQRTLKLKYLMEFQGNLSDRFGYRQERAGGRNEKQWVQTR